jgi:LPPG:FO 2-phospho-L-lactate transferase
VAISPIIGGTAVKGPAAQMLESLGYEVSALGVAKLYSDIVGTFVLDEFDQHLAESVAALGMRPVVAPTLMTGPSEKRALAEVALRALEVRAAEG